MIMTYQSRYLSTILHSIGNFRIFCSSGNVTYVNPGCLMCMCIKMYLYRFINKQQLQYNSLNSIISSSRIKI